MNIGGYHIDDFIEPVNELSLEELQVIEDAITRYVLSGGDANVVTSALNKIGAKINDLQAKIDNAANETGEQNHV